MHELILRCDVSALSGSEKCREGQIYFFILVHYSLVSRFHVAVKTLEANVMSQHNAATIHHSKPSSRSRKAAKRYSWTG